MVALILPEGKLCLLANHLWGRRVRGKWCITLVLNPVFDLGTH
jgi:hypothetical protein